MNESLLVSFEFKNEWLYILSCIFPLTNTFFCIRVELLFILVKQSLCSCCSLLFSPEFLFSFLLFMFNVLLVMTFKFFQTHSFFFSLLLLSNWELFISNFPKLSKFLLLFHLLLFLLLPLLNLKLSIASFISYLLCSYS